MSRITLARTVNPVIPLAGVPIKNYINTYMATKLNLKCRLKALYRLTKCQRSAENSAKELNCDALMYINNYMNMLFAELLDLCIEGTLDIECDYEIPDIVLFVIGTTELLLNIIKPKRAEYDDYLQTLSVLDSKFWSIEPAYTTSLRCAYLYQGTCICRNIHELVKLEALDTDIKYVVSVKCSNNICLELKPPFDNQTILYVLKLTSHVISKIAQDMLGAGSISESTISHLNLLYSTETCIALETLGQNPSFGSFVLPKPVADITSIKFYTINLKKK